MQRPNRLCSHNAKTRLRRAACDSRIFGVTNETMKEVISRGI